MAFLNFLTQGQPLPSTSSSLTTSQVPQYLSDYLYNLMSGAYSAAQEPYQAYQGPRIAGFTAPQQQAFQLSSQAAGAYKPQLTAAEQTVGQAAGLNTMQAAQPYFNAASQAVPDIVGSYMNPYMENVTNRMGDIAARQVSEKLLPQLSDTFTRAGQYGSTRQQDLAQRGVRDISENLAGQIGSQLAQGYTTAGTQAQADLQRLAQMGQAAGTLTGTQQQQLANIANVQAGLGQKEQALGIQGAAALEATGAQQQAMNQRNLDLAYQDFLTQTQYPQQQIGFLSNVIRGLPSGGGTQAQQTTGSGQAYSASPLAQLASAGLSAAAISNLLPKS